MDKRFCLDLNLDDIKKWCQEKKFPAFRAGQIFKWLSAGVIDTEEMTNVPKNIRQALEDDFIMNGMNVIHEFKSQIDGTTKYVYLLHDGNIIDISAIDIACVRAE